MKIIIPPLSAYHQCVRLLLHVGLNLHMLEELNSRLLQSSREGVLNPVVRHLHATPAVNRDLKPGRRNATLGKHKWAYSFILHSSEGACAYVFSGQTHFSWQNVCSWRKEQWFKLLFLFYRWAHAALGAKGAGKHTYVLCILMHTLPNVNVNIQKVNIYKYM